MFALAVPVWLIVLVAIISAYANKYASECLRLPLQDRFVDCWSSWSTAMCGLMHGSLHMKFDDVVAMSPTAIASVDSEPALLYASLQTEPGHSHVDLKADAESGGRSDITNGVEASKTRSKIHFNFSCVPVVLPETSRSIRL